MSHTQEAPRQIIGQDETGTDWQSIPPHTGSAVFRKKTGEIRITAPDKNLLPELVNGLDGIQNDGARDPVGENSRIIRIETPQYSQKAPVTDVFIAARDLHS